MTLKYPFEAILFDMDGVIIDNTSIHEYVWLQFARSKGCNPSKSEIRAMNGRRASDVIVSLFEKKIESDIEISSLVAEREVLYNQYLTKRALKAVSGVKLFLSELNNLDIPLILATSATLNNATITLNRLKLSTYFNAIITAENVHNGKPNPEIYLTAAKHLDVNPADCLVIEDSIPGVQAAKSAGAYCLGITTSQSGNSLKKSGADWVAPDFLRLPKPIQFYLSIALLHNSANGMVTD